MNVNVGILANSEPMFDIEVNKGNITNIERDENQVVYLSLKHFNESLVESVTGDSNYVSEDSVTLTEGSVEKDEDSIDIVTNDLSDEAMIISSPETNPEDMKDEYYMNNTVNDISSEEIVGLCNTDVLLDNSESDKFNENISLEIKEVMYIANPSKILNSYSNEINYYEEKGLEISNEANIVKNDSNSTELSQETKLETHGVNLDIMINCTQQLESMDKSENIIETELENNVVEDRNYDKQMNVINQQEGQLNLALFGNEQMELKKNLINVTKNLFQHEHLEKIIDPKFMVVDDSSVHSELRMAFIKHPGVHQDNLDSISSDLDTVDLDEHEFDGSDWLYSTPCSLKNDQFDMDSTFSFGKMRLATEMINDSNALTFKLCNKSDYVQNFNDYNDFFYMNSLFQKEPVEIISSTPCSNPLEFINSKDNTPENCVNYSVSNSVNENLKILENTFRLNPCEPYETRVFTDLPLKMEPVITDNASIIEEGKSVNNSLLAMKQLRDSLKTNPYKPTSRTIKRPSESHIDKANVDQPSGISKPKTLLRKPNDATKTRQIPSSLKIPSGIGKPLSKITSQILSPTVINGVEIRSKPQTSSEATRRHTVVEVASKNSKIGTKITRPTSLIKPAGEFKIPLGSHKDVKPSRVSLPATVSELRKRNSIPSGAQKPIATLQKETEIPKTIPVRRNTAGIPLAFKPRLTKGAIPRSETQPVMITPIQSENPPIISPALPMSNNPLNRTFDREDFQILKSLTNSNNNDADNPSMTSSSETIRSSTDSENNNRLLSKKSLLLSKENENMGIYQLALKEEENLKKQVHTALNRQVNELRSLRQPTQQKPRGIPMLKK